MRAAVDRGRVEELIAHLGRAASSPTRVYLVGGSSAVLVGWRASTIDVDLAMRPDDDAIYRAIAEAKNALDINIELASPDHFIPLPAGWEERSPLIQKHALASFHHFDFYSQALAKIERGHRQDLDDVAAMRAHKLIEWDALERYYEEIEPSLFRFPAIDPASFRRAVDAIARA